MATSCPQPRPQPRLLDTAPAVHNRHDQNSTIMVINGAAAPPSGQSQSCRCRYLPQPALDCPSRQMPLRGVNNQAQSGGVQRFKTQADQQCGGNRSGVPSRGSFKESAEQNRRSAFADAGQGLSKERRANDVKLPGFTEILQTNTAAKRSTRWATNHRRSHKPPRPARQRPAFYKTAKPRQGRSLPSMRRRRILLV